MKLGETHLYSIYKIVGSPGGPEETERLYVAQVAGMDEAIKQADAVFVDANGDLEAVKVIDWDGPGVVYKVDRGSIDRAGSSPLAAV